MIGSKAGEGQQEKMRAELERHDHPDRGRIVVSQLREHEPILGRALHPRSDVGDDRTAGPHPVIEAVQRAESAFHRAAPEAAISALKELTRGCGRADR
jgi:hypothetical protein